MNSQNSNVQTPSRPHLEAALEAARGCKTIQDFVFRLPVSHPLAVEYRELADMLGKLQAAHLGRMVGGVPGEEYQRGYQKGFKDGAKAHADEVQRIVDKQISARETENPPPTVAGVPRAGATPP